MQERDTRLISMTALALIMAAGAGPVTAARAAQACRPAQTVRTAANACKANPCAVKRNCNPCAGGKSCSPCAAKSRCNPCAAKKSCSPCGAGNPCNPCLASGIPTKCVIPRLASAHRSGNPCAVKKGCSPCGPGKSCNPCAARKGCNPCAAKKGCNPCAAKKSCNPCAAKKGCNPCNPCGAGEKEPPVLSDAERVAAYDCVAPYLAKAYAKSCRPAARTYPEWRRFSKLSYPAEAHGIRFMNNYANETARDDYGKWEAGGTMPAGSVLAKDSFIVGENGAIAVGPLFLMSKGAAGSNAVRRDWTYTMIMPDGSVREDAGIQKFCNDCHRRAGAEDDNLMFLPLPYRVTTSN